jgi:hypothetical protein
MKTILKKWQLLPVYACVFILLSSWRFTENNVNATFSKFLDSQTSSVSGKVADQKVIDRFFAGLKNKKASSHTNFYAYYSVQEIGSPYLDANLLVEIDNTQQIFEFWSVYSSFSSIIGSGGAQMRVAAPIFLAWEGSGCYRLHVMRYDAGVGNYVTEFFQTKYYGPGNTPDYVAFDETFTIYPGEYYQIHVAALPNCSEV